MSRADAKAFYDRAPGDPVYGYVIPVDAQDCVDTTYDDFEGLVENVVWQGTQAEYDHVVHPDPSVLYVITG